MININGNLINEEKVLQVKPYQIRHWPPYTREPTYTQHLEITYENGIVSNINATLEQYDKALKGDDK